MCLPCTIQSTRKLLVHVWLWLKIYHPFFISLFVCLFAHLLVYMSSVQRINLQSQSNVYEGLKSIPDRKLVCPPFSLALFISSPSGWFGVRGWTIGIELTIPRANFLSPNPLFSTLLSPPLPLCHFPTWSGRSLSDGIGVTLEVWVAYLLLHPVGRSIIWMQPWNLWLWQKRYTTDFFNW